MPLASKGMDAVASSARHRDVAYERCVKKVVIYSDLKTNRRSVSLPAFFSDKRKFGRRQGENTARIIKMTRRA